MSEVKITRKCKEQDCKQEFSISQEEANWYIEKQLAMPKRCPDCRNRNKQRRNKLAAELIEAWALGL